MTPYQRAAYSRSGCERCERKLYFASRAAGHRWCWACAGALGVVQIGDNLDERLRKRGERVPVWWRWSIFLAPAILWVEHDRKASRRTSCPRAPGSLRAARGDRRRSQEPSRCEGALHPLVQARARQEAPPLIAIEV